MPSEPVAPVEYPAGPYGPGVSGVRPVPPVIGEPAPVIGVTDVTVSEVYGAPLSGKLRGVRAVETQKTRIRMQLVDNARGGTLNLRPLGFVSGAVPLEPTPDVVDEGVPRIKFRFAEAFNQCGSVPEAESVRIEDAELGVVSCLLPESIAICRGVYNVEAGVFDYTDSLVYVNRCLLIVEPSLFGGSPRSVGIAPVDDVRVAMRDHPVLNRLILEYEHDLGDIAEAYVRAIGEFNSTPPPVGSYNTQNFPWPYQLVRGTIGLLLESAAFHFRRSRLKHQAGGLEIDDLNREREYLGASQSFRQEWRQFVIQTRTQMNIADMFGSSASPYLGSSYGW